MDIYSEGRKKMRNFLGILLLIFVASMGTFLFTGNGWVLFFVWTVAVIRTVCYIAILINWLTMKIPRKEFYKQYAKFKAEGFLSFGAGIWGLFIEFYTGVCPIDKSPSLVLAIAGFVALVGMILLNPQNFPRRLFRES